MRFITVSSAGTSQLAIESDGKMAIPSLQLPDFPAFDSLLALLQDPNCQSYLERLKIHSDWLWQDYQPEDLFAPIPRTPKNIMCLGWNYVEHAEESMQAKGVDAQLPAHPIVFTKAATSITGPYQTIPSHADVSSELDWEVELAVVIGKAGTHIKKEDVFDHIFGYTIINDISARDLQFRHKQYFLGKSLQGACPMGPVVVSRDEIENVQNLGLRSWVNRILKQNSNTRHQIFSVADTVAILSSMVLLEPGDIIATGTPSGVGFARQPPEFLGPGDEVVCEIDGIGKIVNTVI